MIAEKNWQEFQLIIAMRFGYKERNSYFCKVKSMNLKTEEMDILYR